MVGRRILLGLLLGAACVEAQTFTPLGELELVAPPSATIRDGATIAVPISIVRGTGLTESVSLRLEEPPAGFSMAVAEIEGAASSGTIELAANGVVLGKPLTLRLVAESQGKSATTTFTMNTVGVVGVLDRGFGASGKLSLPSNVDRECRAHIAPQGRILVDTSPLDRIEITRVSPDGAIDTTFGINGRFARATLFGTLTRSQNTSVLIALQPNDKTLVGVSIDDPAIAGRYDGIVVLRLTADGMLDTSFGSSGFLVFSGPSRLWGLATSASGELSVWYSSIGVGASVSRYTVDGVFAASSPVFTAFGPAAADMTLQADGKPVLVANDGVAYSLVRLTADLRLDPGFGRNGLLPLTGVPLRWVARADGSYFGVGLRYDYPTPGALGGYAIHFDSAWRAITGFETGGVTFADIATTFVGSIESEGGTLLSALVEGEGRLYRLTADGKRDQAFGGRGWKTIDSSGRMSPAGEYQALVSYPKPGQSCELLRIWR